MAANLREESELVTGSCSQVLLMEMTAVGIVGRGWYNDDGSTRIRRRRCGECRVNDQGPPGGQIGIDRGFRRLSYVLEYEKRVNCAGGSEIHQVGCADQDHGSEH